MQDPGEASHADGAAVEVEKQRFRRPAPRAGTAADARDEREFSERLAALTPRVWVTPTIVALNVLVFVTMVDEPASYFNRSLAHEGLGDLAAAAADVRSYLEAIPDDADGLARLAELEARARDD